MFVGIKPLKPYRQGHKNYWVEVYEDDNTTLVARRSFYTVKDAKHIKNLLENDPEYLDQFIIQSAVER